MAKEVSVTLPKYPVIFLTAYLVLASVTVVELSLMPEAENPWPMVGLLTAFGGLLTAKPFIKVFSWQTHLYLALQTGIVTGLLFLRPGSLMLPMLFCVISVTAPLLLSLRSAVFWIVIFAVINMVHCTTLKDGEHSWIVSLPYTVGYVFCGAFAYSLAGASAAQHRSEALLAELQTTYQQLQEYTARVEELAVSQERNRLAREMHDAVGHRLTVAAVQLEGAERLIPTQPGRATQMVNTVHRQVVEALAELRRTVATLGTPLDVDLSLPKALTRLTTRFEEATGLKVNRSLPDDVPFLPEAHRLALYRAAQEALTNVQRHAHARQIWLELTLENKMITLLVKDDGRGFDSEIAPTGFGLRGLRERATHLNGEFHLESIPGQGTQICFHLPMPLEGEVSPLPPAKSRGWKLTCPFGCSMPGASAPATLNESLKFL